jgi:uncharacterized protein YdeI (YjbR/CyaY-like superfamily)
MQDEYSCLSTETKKYMRDVYVHIENMVEVIEGQLELCAGLLTIFDNHQVGYVTVHASLLCHLFIALFLLLSSDSPCFGTIVECQD